ncbi:hypothetical protein BH10BDE1_BH10BDE1_12930 [soil metagenome]
MKTYRLFSFVSLATIVLAHATWEASHVKVFDPKSLIGFAIIYGASIWLRDYFYDEKTTFFDADARVLPVKDDGLIVFGEQIEDLAFESEERRLLIDLVDFGGRKYKIYAAWIVSVVLAVYLQIRVGGSPSVESIAAFCILSAIYFSPFLNQQFVPLFIAMLLALYGFGRSDTFQVTVLFVFFLATFCYAVVLFREAPSDRVNPDRKFSSRKRMRSAAVVAAIFISFYFVVDLILPEENPFHSKGPGLVVPDKKPPRFSTEHISRKFAEQVVKLGEQNQDAKLGPASNEDGDADRGRPSAGGTSKADREGAPSANTGDEPSSASRSDSVPSASRSDSDPSASRSDSTPAKSQEGGRPSEARDGTSNDQSPTVGTNEPSSDSQKASPGANAESPSTSPARAVEKSKEREKKIEDLQLNLKLPIELLKGLGFLILAGLLVTFVARYFSRKKPQDEEVVRQELSPKQRQKLQTVLQRIRARGLSPNEEIVETYNLLLSIFEVGHHTREEWLPAEDFSKQISNSIPVLSGPFSGATERFSCTLYGRRDVGEAELTKFRGEVSKILQFFQLS